jgi:hypothetical protein
MLEECQTLLHLWQHDPDRDYSVRSAYQLLTSQQVPLKMFIFALKMLQVPFGCSRRTCLTQASSLKDVYFCPETLARHIANKRKFGHSRHHHSRSSLLCVRLQCSFCNSFGSYLFGLCGTKEIKDY